MLKPPRVAGNKKPAPRQPGTGMRSAVVPPLFAVPSRTPPHEVSPLRLPARSRWPVRLRLLPPGAGSGSRSEGHLGAGWAPLLSVAALCGSEPAGYFPSSSRFRYVLVNVPAGQIKSPSKARGYIRGRISPLPYLTDRSVGIGTWTAASGCRVSSGRFPPPLLIRAGCYSVVVANYSTGFRILSRLHRRACGKVSVLTFPHRADGQAAKNRVNMSTLRVLRTCAGTVRAGAVISARQVCICSRLWYNCTNVLICFACARIGRGAGCRYSCWSRRSPPRSPPAK
jgi:hypothetical protein